MLKGLRSVLSQERKTAGNYFQRTQGSVTEVFYHSTVICAYDRTKEVFFAGNRGFNTPSTNRAVGDARYWCEGRGYREVTCGEFKDMTGAQCPIGRWEGGCF